MSEQPAEESLREAEYEPDDFDGCVHGIGWDEPCEECDEFDGDED